MFELYCDGGCISRNPSLIGGTWAWCIVRDDTLIASASGMVSPSSERMAWISNNYTELLAAVLCLEHFRREMGDKAKGILHTDSSVTRGRLVGKKPKFANIPKELVNRAVEAKRSIAGVILLAGHPTAQELGVGRRGSTPVSKWNVLCDKMCSKESKNQR